MEQKTLWTLGVATLALTLCTGIAAKVTLGQAQARGDASTNKASLQTLPNLFGLTVGTSMLSDLEVVTDRENWTVVKVLKINILGERLKTDIPPRDGSVPYECYKEDPSEKLVCVKGPAIEGLFEARYAFHDNRLYRIEYWFVDPDARHTPPPQRSIDFRQLLTKKYGEPGEPAGGGRAYSGGRDSAGSVLRWYLNRNTQKEVSIKLDYVGEPSRPETISYQYEPVATALTRERRKFFDRLYNNRGMGAEGL